MGAAYDPDRAIEILTPPPPEFSKHIPPLPGEKDEPDDGSASTEIMPAILEDDIPPVQIDDDDPDDDSQDAITTTDFEAVGGIRTTLAGALQSGMPRRPRDYLTTSIGRNLRREILSKANGECITFTSLTEAETADMLQAITQQAPAQEVIDARDSGAEIPKDLETWNMLPPIFIIPQGHNAFRNRVGSDLAKAVLTDGRGLIVFVKPVGIETDSDAKPNEGDEQLVFDLHPDYADIERAVYILIDLCVARGTKEIRSPEAIESSDDLNILISVEIVRRLYEEAVEERLRSARGRRFVDNAKVAILERQSREIERKLGRPAKDEEIRIDNDEARQIALGEMIKDENEGKTISDELLARFRAMPEERRMTVIAELYEIFTHTEHLVKGIALLRGADAYTDKQHRLMHGWEMLKYIENECLDRKQETGIEKSTIEKGESDLLSGNSPESEQYIRTLKYLVMRSFEQMQSEKGEEKMELCMPHGRMTLQNAMGHLTANTSKGEILRGELLSKLSLDCARMTLEKIEELIDTDITEEHFDVHMIADTFRTAAEIIKDAAKTQDKREIERIIYEVLPQEIPAFQGTLNDHDDLERDEIIDRLLEIAEAENAWEQSKIPTTKDKIRRAANKVLCRFGLYIAGRQKPYEESMDVYSYLWQITRAAKGKTLEDLDILDSHLTPAICIIKMAMHALKRFNDFDTLEKEMYDWTGEMLEIAGELTSDSIPPHLPVELARLRKKYAPQEKEREAVIELDLYEHQTLLCA